MGGSDVCPATYGETPLQPEWNGDRIRDDYEIALLRAFMALQQAGARRLPRRAGDQRRARRHAVPGPRARRRRTRSTTATGRSTRRTATRRRSCPAAASRGSIPGTPLVKTNSIHHQAVKDLGRDLVVEAWSEPDRIVEAIRWTGPSYLFGVQWHPEFHAPDRPLVHRRHAAPRRLPRRRGAAQVRRVRTVNASGAPMKITQSRRPARVIADVAADNAAAVRAQVRARARRRSPPGRQVPIAQAPRRDREVPRADRRDARDARAHADARGRQADPPVAQRAERPARRASTSSSPQSRARAARREGASPTPGRSSTSASRHEPLGVVANISAWNYPYFVGSNVFVPALRRRQRRALQAVRVRDADRPAHRRAAARGRRAATTCSCRWSATARPAPRCSRSRSTACSSPARTRPARRSPRPPAGG